MFNVGEKVVYPSHGVGLIEAVEEKEVSGTRLSFYVLRLFGHDMTILVPTAKAKRVGLRQVIRPSEIPKVIEVLKKDDLEICPNWNRRFKENMERIRSGSLYEVALVLRKLVLLQKSRGLSFGEKMMFENARQLIISEIAHSKGVAEEEARLLIDETIATA